MDQIVLLVIEYSHRRRHLQCIEHKLDDRLLNTHARRRPIDLVYRRYDPRKQTNQLIDPRSR